MNPAAADLYHQQIRVLMRTAQAEQISALCEPLLDDANVDLAIMARIGLANAAYLRGHYAVAAHHARTALERAREAETDLLIAHAIIALYDFELELNPLVRATMLDEAHTLASRHQDDFYRVLVLMRQALLTDRGVEAKLAQALQLATASGDDGLLVWVTFDIGYYALNKGRIKEADRYFKQSLALAVKINSLVDVCIVHILRASAASQLNPFKHYEDSLELAKQAYLEVRSLNHVTVQLFVYRIYIELQLKHSRYDEVLQACTDYRTLAEQVEILFHRFNAPYYTGLALARQGNYTEAIKYFEPLISFDKKHLIPLANAHLSFELATAYRKLGQYELAFGGYRRALNEYQTHMPLGLRKILTIIILIITLFYTALRGLIHAVFNSRSA